MKKNFKLKASYIPPILGVIGILLILIFRINASFTDKVYSNIIFPVLSRIISFATSIFPFSLSELIILISCIISIIWVMSMIVSLVYKGKNLLNCLYFGFSTVCIVFFLFAITAAPNYYRYTFSEQTGLVITESAVDELVELCESLVQEANENVNYISYNSYGNMILNEDYTGQALTYFNSLAKETYPFIKPVHSRPKPIIVSYLLSMLELTGFYFPYTAEANFNNHMPTFDIPTTMTHELSHTAGFMREDEANFIAYMACKNSDSYEFKYSASILGITYCMNTLYKEDYNQFARIHNTYDPRLSNDLKKINDYWNKFDTPVAEISNAVNDTYLKLNNLPDGTKSYGRIVDLMLADFKASR